MNNEQFEAVFEDMVSTSRNLLVEKAKEYASDKDRLHNFKAAAGALDVTPELALRGMSTKHTISVNDMVKNPDKYTMEQWQEKIGDEFNYLILLKALVTERINARGDRATDDCPDKIDGISIEDVDIPEGLTVTDWYPHPFDFGAVLVKYTDGTTQTLRHRNADEWKGENTPAGWSQKVLDSNKVAVMEPLVPAFDHQDETTLKPFGGNKPNATYRMVYRTDAVPVYAEKQNSDPTMTFVIFESGRAAKVETDRIDYINFDKEN